jgi:hypothetical protein
MPKKLIFKDNSEQFTIPPGYTALVSTNGDFKKQVESTVTTLGSAGSSGELSLTELGFEIVSAPSVINQDITLPDNYEFEYPSPLIIGEGYTLTVPSGTTLTIV